MKNQTKIVPYLLVLPTPVPPSPSINSAAFEREQINEENSRYRNTKKGLSAVLNCNCLTGVFAGLSVLSLLALAIAVPVVVVLSTETSSDTTSEATTILSTSTTTTTTTTSTTTTTDKPCIPACNSFKTCVQGVCVGIGYLSCTLTWSRDGDGDIVVRTANNKVISYINPNISSATDFGQLDVDDKDGTGPENIFWSNSSVSPPNGTYYVCFSQYNFNPNATSQYPIVATVKIKRSTNVDLIFTRNFTSYYRNASDCYSNSPHFLGSFTFP